MAKKPAQTKNSNSVALDDKTIAKLAVAITLASRLMAGGGTTEEASRAILEEIRRASA